MAAHIIDALNPGALAAFHQHLDGAVGSLSICRMFEMQPILYRSSAVGSSLAADFCATSRMLLPASMAISIALIDFWPSDKERDDHVREHDHVPQRQQRITGSVRMPISFDMAFPEKRINGYIGRCAPVQAAPPRLRIRRCVRDGA